MALFPKKPGFGSLEAKNTTRSFFGSWLLATQETMKRTGAGEVIPAAAEQGAVQHQNERKLSAHLPCLATMCVSLVLRATEGASAHVASFGAHRCVGILASESFRSSQKASSPADYKSVPVLKVGLWLYWLGQCAHFRAPCRTLCHVCFSELSEPPSG